MPKESAIAVAQEVISEVRKGKIPNKQVIQRKHGYSASSARAMKATRTRAYKETMRPLLERLEEERDRAISMLKGRISKAKYRDLIDGLDKITKNIQLLSGGRTGDETIVINWEK